MRHYVGLSEYHLRQRQQEVPVYWDPTALINGHLLLTGMSGTGKSWQTMRLLDTAGLSGAQVDIFDVHGELDGVANTVAVKYSQATGYGYNPLKLNTDPHSGGVERQVNFIVGLIKEVTPQFGAKQEAALRYLLIDTYAAAGIRQADARSWHRREITEQQHADLVASRQYQELRQFYPTLEDLRSYSRRKLIALTAGGDNKAITAFEHLCRTRSRLSGLLARGNRATNDEEIEKLTRQIDKTKAEAIGFYTDFVNGMQTGREIDDVIKYDSNPVLSSVIQRIDLLASAGIFRANPPPFGSAAVRTHDLLSLDTAQQVLFVKLRLREIFEQCKQAGKITDGAPPRHVCLIDEGHKFFSSEPDDIINVIAKEARKFGLCLWAASQSPVEFPEHFLTNVGATVILGIHASFWKRAIAMLRLTEEQLRFIKPKEVLSIKLQKSGEPDPRFINVIVPNPDTEEGRRAAARAPR